jgi:heme-degrading monooxygenase HmoA
MFVAMSQFTVANQMADAVKGAFRSRPHIVEDAAGFVRMDVLSPRDNPQELWLLTYWTDEESYRNWHHGHTFGGSHAGIPKGLKLVPGSARIRCFDHVSA